MSKLYHAAQIPSSKVCKVCRIEKPLEDFYVQRRNKYGRATTCIECTKSSTSLYRFRLYRQAKIVQLPLFKEAKICTKCKVEKSLDCFRKCPGKRDGHREQCKECMKKIYKEKPHKPRNEQQRQKRRQYQQSRREQTRQYSHNYSERNREKEQARNRAWRKNNRTWTRERDRRRAALKRAATVEKVDYQKILARDGYYCYICEDTIKPEEVQYDHVIPLIRGGSHTEDNIKVTHRICNQRKREKLLEEMTPHQRRGVK